MVTTETAEKSSGIGPAAQMRRDWGIAPGVALTAAIAGAASLLHKLPFAGALNTLTIAMVLGIAASNTVGVPAAAAPGVSFSLRKLLRFAIILLGLQLSFKDIAEVGDAGLIVVAGSLAATFAFTVWAGAKMGIDRKLTELIAAGSSICGASAVIATNVVTEGNDEDVAYSIACVTVFGSLSMFLFPLLPHWLGLSPRAFGLWAGASIHEIAQVVAAAFQDGPVSGHIATIGKLTRVSLLAPTVLMLGIATARRSQSGDGINWKKIPIPWFVVGFVAMIGVNTLGIIPPLAKTAVIAGNQFLLTMALTAMGLETKVAKLKRKGVKPLALGAAAWAFISIFSYGLIKLLY